MADSDRPTRTRGAGAESAARRAALERLQAIQSGRAHVAQVPVKIEEPIYETVSEEAYKELVEKRRADGEPFIVDDGDLGYADDGREDWADNHAHEKQPRKKSKPSSSVAVKKPQAPTPLVALRLGKNGDTRFSVGQTVPYIICIEQEASSGPTGIAQRARHRDELNGNEGNWLIDIDYYLSVQIHPVVSRLCGSIQGTSPARLAECLGLDSLKFQSRISETSSEDPSSVLLSTTQEEERYRDCEPLRLSCPSCSATFDCPPVSSLLTTSAGTDAVGTENDNNYNFWHRMRCSRCPADAEGCFISAPLLANQCDAETCKYTTRSVNLRLVGDANKSTVCPRYPSCDGHLFIQYTKADLYKQLSYFSFVLDSSWCLHKLDHKTRASIQRQFASVRQAVHLALEEIEKILDRCDYAWVPLSDIAVSI